MTSSFMREKLPALTMNWRKHVPWLVSLVLIILLARSAAILTWSLIAPEVDITAPNAPGMERVTTSPSTSSFVESLQSQGLFGVEPAPETAPTLDAPETQLNIVLRGVFAGATDQTSRAIISNGNVERSYGIGDSIANGITVRSIHSDRVIISRRGNLESVRLPRESGILDSESMESVNRPPLQEPADTVAAIPPDGTAAAVATITEIVRPIPVSRDGKQIGFRVYPGRARKKFVDLGLQAGDIITSINNIPLDDPEVGVEAFESLKEADSVTVNLIRDGQDQQLVLQTGN